MTKRNKLTRDGEMDWFWFNCWSKVRYQDDKWIILDKYYYYQLIDEPKPWGDDANILINKKTNEIVRQFATYFGMEDRIKDLKKEVVNG